MTVPNETWRRTLIHLRKTGRVDVADPPSGYFLELIAVNNSYVRAGVGSNMDELCMGVHRREPCRRTARPGRQMCGRKHRPLE